MSKARSPSGSKSAISVSGSQSAPQQPRGLLPRSLKKGEGNSEVIELLMQIAEQWYPGISNLEELDGKEQKFWIRFREGVLQGQYGIAELAKTLNESIKAQVDAGIEDAQTRRAADVESQRRRRETKDRILRKRQRADDERLKADLEDQAQRREERVAQLDQEIKERETKRINRSRKDHLLIAITAISFACSIALIAAGAMGGQPIAYGGSGIFGVVSVAGMVRLFLLGDDRPAAHPSPPEGG